MKIWLFSTILCASTPIFGTSHLFEQGERQWNSLLIEESITSFSTFLKQQAAPNPLFRLRVATLLLSLERYPEAIVLLTTKELPPPNEEETLLLALAYMKSGAIEKAKPLFNQLLLVQNEIGTQAAFSLTEALIKQWDLAAARTLLQSSPFEMERLYLDLYEGKFSAVEAHLPTLKPSPFTQYLKGYLACEKGEWANAVEALKAIEEVKAARLLLGWAYLQQGDVENAKRAFASLPSEPQAQIGLSLCKQPLSNPTPLARAILLIEDSAHTPFLPALQEAKLLLNASIEENPHSPAPAYWLARAQFIEGNPIAASADIEIEALRLSQNLQESEVVSFYAKYPQNNVSSRLLLLLASSFFERGDYEKAAYYYEKVAAEKGELAPEAYFYWAVAKEKLGGDRKAILAIRKTLFENYPSSPLAAEAYFSSYTYQEYIQGDPEVEAHLIAMERYFPNSPYTILSHYLRGLYAQSSPKILSLKKRVVKDGSLAEEQFRRAEQLFDRLYQEKLIPEKTLPFFTNILSLSRLERANDYFTKALEAKSAKKALLLEQALDVYQQLISTYQTPSVLKTALTAENPYPYVEQEADFGVLKVAIARENREMAKIAFENMRQKFSVNGITRSFFLAKALETQGTLAMADQQWLKALDQFKEAKLALGVNPYPSDQKLELMLLESECWKQLNDLDKAMLTLSQVVNENVVSSLRVKAMYLRGEIYELQGRKELALKQWLATSKQAGEWAEKAKQKLGSLYE